MYVLKKKKSFLQMDESQSFEKDNDIHMKFIFAAANLRCFNFALSRQSWVKTRSKKSITKINFCIIDQL